MSFHSRLLSANDFTEEFQMFIMKTFFPSEPMNQCLETKIPDEIDFSWFKQVLDKAKLDQLSLAFYDSNFSQTLPIAFAINHHDQLHDLAPSDILYSSSNQPSAHKHDHISHLMTKLHENINLFDRFQCQRLFHIYFLGVHPDYRRNRLASQLITSSMTLAREKNFDLIYADVTSDYSLNAFLRSNFQTLKTIEYQSYENLCGERVFQNIPLHRGCSIVFKDLRIE